MDRRFQSISETDDSLLVGRIARAHGNRGQVIVNLETDFAEERFVAGQILRIEQDGRTRERRIVSVRFHQGRPIIAFEGVDTMDDAEALAGAELTIAASRVAPLAVGTFYHRDLIGCEVRDRAHRTIGTVVRIDGPMNRSILVVDAPGGEVLIPLVADICVQVDPAAKVVIVNPPEGLIELNERTAAGRP
jgi:16S rRNA processing protein RimM